MGGTGSGPIVPPPKSRVRRGLALPFFPLFVYNEAWKGVCLPVKKFLKAFYLLIVGLVVFTGALIIAKGARQHGEPTASAAQTMRAIPLDEENDSAA